jgi:acyl-CoA synthetase (NDP forming)
MAPQDLRRNGEHFLARFFDPESVAVVGASNNPARINYHLVANLIKLGFRGRIYPVHPSEKEILGLKAFRSVKDIPETVDLAVIGVSYTVTPEVLKECVEKGIKRVTLIAGGFSEAGEEGKGVQAQMARMVRQNGIRVIGPNALSPISVRAGFCISFHAIDSIKAGGLSLIFQSGLYEPRLGWLLNDFNYHLNKLIDLGNKMDVNEVVTDRLEQGGLRLAETNNDTLDKLRAVFPAWEIPGEPLGPRPHRAVSRSRECLFGRPPRHGCRSRSRCAGSPDSPGVSHGP